MRSRFRFQFCLCRLLKNYPPNPWSPPVSLSRHSLVQARTLGISLSLTTPPLPNHPKSHKVISQISHKLACFLTISTTVTLVSPSSCTSYCKPLFSSLPFNILTPLQFILPIFISSKSGIYMQPWNIYYSSTSNSTLAYKVTQGQVPPPSPVNFPAWHTSPLLLSRPGSASQRFSTPPPLHELFTLASLTPIYLSKLTLSIRASRCAFLTLTFPPYLSLPPHWLLIRSVTLC